MHFSLFLATLCLFLPHSARVRGDCGPCSEQNCPPVACRVPELLARDECACCPQCLSLEGQPCGGRGQGRARCAAGLVCVSHSAGGTEEQSGTGLCVCKEDSAVCGSDGSSHRSVCALHLHSWEAQRAGRDRIHKAHDGECTLAPVITLAPKRIHNNTGAQVYLSCEVKAVPTPIVTWRKVTESPKGIKLLEDLPGDRVNMAVQVRGGPSRHESTGWVLINPLTKEDEGVYQCHAANMMGEAHADGTIRVTEQTKSKKAHHRTSDDKK